MKTIIQILSLFALFSPINLLAITTHNVDKIHRLSDEQVTSIVEKSYQYVTLYNIIIKLARSLNHEDPNTPLWNRCQADPNLRDADFKAIARPNNDNFFVRCTLKVDYEPVIVDLPTFNSKYVSLMYSGFDHYINVPLSTRLGDFNNPERVLFYSKRTPFYRGEAIPGIDRYIQLDGDFAILLLRVMPHLQNPERHKQIVKDMQLVKAATLLEYAGHSARFHHTINYPEVSETALQSFNHNLLDIMSFVFAQNTFDPKNKMDREVAKAYKVFGLRPNQSHQKVSKFRALRYQPARFAAIAEQVRQKTFIQIRNPNEVSELVPLLYRPKHQTSSQAVLTASIIGPLGLPTEEATYLNITDQNGDTLNAMHDYVIRLTADTLPPTLAFWSFTLYDLDNGFFIPNDRKKYSVGENSGFKLNPAGGIDIYIAAKRPEGTPLENWLPIARTDLNLALLLRMYLPNLTQLDSWQPPTAELIN